MQLSLGRALKSLVLGMPALVTGGRPRFRAGEAQLALRELGVAQRLLVQSEAFADGGSLPASCAADRGNQSPPLRWSGVPSEARSLVLLIEDPDAPTPRPFVHWMVFNIDPAVTSLKAGARFEIQGKSSSLKTGYKGAAPPKGDVPHRYHFQLFALDRLLPLPDGAGRRALLRAMRGHVLAAGELVGTYSR